jgi:hypothetical protein
LSGFPFRVLQQRLRQHVVDDSYDNQPLHSHHLSTSLSEDLSDKVHHSSAVLCLVHLVSDHGELEMQKKGNLA